MPSRTAVILVFPRPLQRRPVPWWRRVVLRIRHGRLPELFAS